MIRSTEAKVNLRLNFFMTKRAMARISRLPISIQRPTFVTHFAGFVETFPNAIFNHIPELHQMGALVLVSPITIYNQSELQDAIRLMQSGKHIGKVVITAGRYGPSR